MPTHFDMAISLKIIIFTHFRDFLDFLHN